MYCLNVTKTIVTNVNDGILDKHAYISFEEFRDKDIMRIMTTPHFRETKYHTLNLNYPSKLYITLVQHPCGKCFKTIVCN